MQCEVFGYPKRTTCGDRMFENTHFLTRAEAWESIRQSAEAEIKWAAVQVEEAEESLVRAKERAAVAAVRMAKVLEGLKQREE
jgi:hypothetical protein